MAAASFSVSALIPAPAEALYAILADYHGGHPRILPRPPFVSLEVVEGGIGAGSIIRVQMRVLGQLQGFRAVVTEPEPGRVLVETNDTGYVTTFTVEPRGEGEAEVTIATELARTGWAARLEGWMTARLLRRVYRRELEQLAEVAGVQVA